MWKLCVGSVEWLYEGQNALKRASFAAKIMMRRLKVRKAVVKPYGGMRADEIYIKL